MIKAVFTLATVLQLLYIVMCYLCIFRSVHTGTVGAKKSSRTISY